MSDSSPVIEIKNLGKTYHLFRHPIDRLKEALSPIRKKYHRDFHALKNVNICIQPGECVGIIGLNGSGKSTLLQIIAEVLTPTTGTVNTNGTIAALLELGAGFNPEFTGIENIYFQCSIMGIAKEKVDELLPKILDFADIGDFVHQPVKTYSSGMYVRLAFSVAIIVDPDILIVDEALAVGDVQFQAKCMRRIREFRAANKTLIFVSHDPGAVKSLCSKAYLLHKGEVIDEGEPNKVFDYYNSLVAEKSRTDAIEEGANKELNRRRSGNGKVTFEKVELLSENGTPVETLTSGDTAIFAMDLKIHEDVTNPSIGILIRDRLGNDIFGTNSFHLGKELGELKAGSSHKIEYRIKMDLGDSIYNLTVAAHSSSTHVEDNYDWINEALAFRIVANPKEFFTGYCKLNPQLKCTSSYRV